LFAKSFDLDRLLASDTAVPVVSKIAANESTASVQVAWSDSGTMVYLPGDAFSNDAPMDWLDRSGKTSRLRETLANWASPRWS
jgi:hypothetical protein